MGQLMKAGALDVYFTPIFMKKNRPATMLSVICASTDILKFDKLILKSTSSKGVRHLIMDRTIMKRHFKNVQVLNGKVQMKIAEFEDIQKVTPEYDDCKKIAQKNHKSIEEVMFLARKEFEKVDN